MKLIKLFLIFLCVGSFYVNADFTESNYETCLEYMYQPNKGSPLPDSPWLLKNNGTNIYIAKWNLTNAQPTRAQIIAVESNALAWAKEKKNTQTANLDNWSNEELKTLALVLLDEINVLRAKEGLAPRTKDDLKQALKNKMQ